MNGNIPQVIHFVPWAEIGGTERVVQNLCLTGGEYRHLVLFAQSGPAVSEFERRHIRVLRPGEITDLARLAMTELQANSPIVLHAHIMKYNHVEHALILARALGVPGLFTLHGREILPPVPWPLVCVSPSVSRAQVHNFERTLVIPNGVSLAEFSPPVHRTQRSSIVLTVVARARRIPDYFWQCVDRIRSVRENCQIWIVGQDGESDRQVKYFGVRGDVSKILAMSDIFIYAPRPFHGAHDLTVLEAMASGLPCICTNVSGVAESITHMHDGILVPFGAIDPFVTAALDLMSSTELRYSLGRHARETVAANFTIEKCWFRYRSAYAGLLGISDQSPSTPA